MISLFKRLTPYLIGFILGILSFIPFTRQTTVASFLTGLEVIQLINGIIFWIMD